jgi:arylsulfatase A-like enzyme
MNRRSFLRAASASLAAAVSGAQSKRPPNIVHFLADDVGYDDIGCYGAKGMATPNLDRMARAGMRFTDFYAPASVCTPSRASILTGRYSCRIKPLQNILYPGARGITPDREITIATLLRKAGYRTGIIGKWHLGDVPESLPTSNGFDEYYGIPYPNDMGPEMRKTDPPIPVYRGLEKVEVPADLPNLPDKFTREAMRFIEENRRRPFFLHFANIETHTPWFTPERFHGKSAIGPYGDSIQCMDWCYGQIADKIRSLGLERETLLVFSSDNGPLAAESPSVKSLHAVYGKYADPRPSDAHLLRGYKGTAHWEGGPRVPAIFRWPGVIPEGRECHEVTGGMDLFTTFATLAGVSVPDDRPMDGKDLMPLLRADPGAASPHPVYYSYSGGRLGGVRKGKWKLSLPPGGEPVLYDLEADLRERKDVATANAGVMKDMLALAEEGRSFAAR